MIRFRFDANQEFQIQAGEGVLRADCWPLRPHGSRLTAHG